MSSPFLTKSCVITLLPEAAGLWKILRLTCVLTVCVFSPSGNLDKQTEWGNTALHYCCMYEKPECLKLLLRGKPATDIRESHILSLKSSALTHHTLTVDYPSYFSQSERRDGAGCCQATEEHSVRGGSKYRSTQLVILDTTVDFNGF